MADLTEEELLAEIFPHLPLGDGTLLGPGDDAAVVAAPDGRVVVSTDVLVEGRHFRREWSDGRDVGLRAAAQNLADVAAMGARPTSVVVVLVAPADLPVAWVRDLARGLGEACEPHGVGVVGGDLSGGEQLVVALTVHGDLDGRDPVLRSGARPGDVVAHAGVLGRSGAGLALLTAGQGDADGELVAAYRVPSPPVAAGTAAGTAGATSMLDVSDGLVRDAGRVARASGVRIDLERGALAADVARLAAAGALVGADPLDWVLTGGEDHGLLATFAPATRLPTGFRRIGTVRTAGARDGAAEPTSTTAGVLLDGAPVPAGGGWDHFSR